MHEDYKKYTKNKNEAKLRTHLSLPLCLDKCGMQVILHAPY